MGTATALRELRESMQGRLSAPTTELRDRCASVSGLLAQWSQSEAPAAESLPSRLRSVATQAATAPPGDQALNWDRAVQTLYLMQALAPGGEAQQKLQEELRFPHFRVRATDASYRRNVRLLLQSAAAALPE